MFYDFVTCHSTYQTILIDLVTQIIWDFLFASDGSILKVQVQNQVCSLKRNKDLFKDILAIMIKVKL